ncbi:hypothetical protein Tco_0770221 [Tanacetum coccineum]|uniref:Uncharacterized protein n=1 Tax=Tanacetum coccineum TaxID=301880 RepID=A0ABQ4ZBU4_9ASTR
MASISISGVSQKGLINHSLDRFWSHVVWVGVVRSSIRSSSCRWCHDSSTIQEKKPVAVAVSDVPRDGSRVHTHDHGGSEAPDGSPDSILSSEPKPLGKHRPPPPPPSILSLGESSYPP